MTKQVCFRCKDIYNITTYTYSSKNDECDICGCIDIVQIATNNDFAQVEEDEIINNY